jgi:hypothetical protein
MQSPVPVSSRFAPVLVALPESGMGYWVVDVHTRKKEVFRRVVIDCGFIVSADRSRDIPFDPEDIVSFEVTHDRTAIVR